MRRRRLLEEHGVRDTVLKGDGEGDFPSPFFLHCHERPLGRVALAREVGQVDVFESLVAHSL